MLDLNWFEFSESKDVLFGQARELRWDSSNIIEIMGSFFTFWMLYMVIIVIHALISSILNALYQNDYLSTKTFRVQAKKQISRKYQLFWNMFIFLLLISNYELLIGVILNFREPKEVKNGDVAGKYLSVIFFIVCFIIAPYLCIQILWKDLNTFR